MSNATTPNQTTLRINPNQTTTGLRTALSFEVVRKDPKSIPLELRGAQRHFYLYHHEAVLGRLTRELRDVRHAYVVFFDPTARMWRADHIETMGVIPIHVAIYGPGRADYFADPYAAALAVLVLRDKRNAEAL